MQSVTAGAIAAAFACYELATGWMSRTLTHTHMRHSYKTRWSLQSVTTGDLG
jgi:hypothetical protein